VVAMIVVTSLHPFQHLGVRRKALISPKSRDLIEALASRHLSARSQRENFCIDRIKRSVASAVRGNKRALHANSAISSGCRSDSGR